jgi:hypothetical protein
MTPKLGLARGKTGNSTFVRWAAESVTADAGRTNATLRLFLST